jgi:cytochrome bd-type quinol oxidase subunit 2
MQPQRVSKSAEIMWVLAITAGVFSSIGLLSFLILQGASVAGFENSVTRVREYQYPWWLYWFVSVLLSVIGALPNMVAALALALLSRRWSWANHPVVWVLVAAGAIQVLYVFVGIDERRTLGEWLIITSSAMIAGVAGWHGLRLARRQTSSRNASTTAR